MTERTDKLALLRAYLDNDKQQIKEMLELFLENTPNDLKELTLLCEKNDVENIRKTAHRVKSSVTFFGLSEVGEILQKMETISRKNQSKNQLKIMATQVNKLMGRELELLRKELIWL